MKDSKSKNKNELTFVRAESSLITGVEGKLLKLFSKKHKNFLETLTSNSFSPIHITECPRRISYRILQPEIVSENGLFKSHEEKENMARKWNNLLSECNGIELVKTDVVVSEGKSNLVGTIDSIIKFCDTFVIVNYQPLSHDSFLSMVESGSLRKHVIENVLYLWMANLRNSLIVYEDQSNKEHKMFHVRTHKPIIESIKDKCLKMIHAISVGRLVDRPYKDNSSKECCECEFSASCWSEEKVNG